jgi:hypothetical protein
VLDNQAISFALKPIGFVRTALGSARTPLRFTRKALGFKRKALGFQRSAVGVTRKALAGSRTLLGIARMPVAVAWTALEVPHEPLANSRTMLGVARTAILTFAKPILTLRRMNRDQLNLTDMFDTVSAYMTKNNTVWSGVPAVGATMTDLDAGIGKIDAADQKQTSPTGGATVDKAQVRHDLEDKILFIADQLAALAAQTKNAVLAGKVEFTLSQLDKMAAENLEATGKNVKDLANANIAALAAYGVLPADVTELDTLTTSFGGKKTAPREAVVDRKKETDTLPDLIAEVRSILRNRLDKQMTAFKRSNAEFYAGYITARVIVDRGGGGGKKPAPPTPPPS